jgi:superfamily II DNA or RNA helicase/diadenosine tetraphosphate (Ap4A) HIT family hydrolase
VSAFASISPAQWIASNAHAFAIRDGYPVSPGHTLVITRRVVADWFAASAEERAAVLELVDAVKEQLDAELQPDGYNVGFNAGAAAGQTVMHLHVHVIPRYRGDMDDPRGGVRHAIPSKGNYLREVAPLAVGGADDPFARHLGPLFRTAHDIAIVAAFVQESGLHHIRGDVLAALDRGARVRILTGDYLDITQASALEMLLGWQETTGKADAGSDADGDSEDDLDDGGAGECGRALEARVIEVERLVPKATSFHPKSWRFDGPGYGVAFVGSSNLSRAALVTGIEWNLRVDRDRDRDAYDRVRGAFEEIWGRARTLDPAWVEAYAARSRARALAAPPGAPPALPTGELEAEPLAVAPEPHEVQRAALDALRATRADGRGRALVVLATGLGKTWLAAFDFAALHEERLRVGADAGTASVGPAGEARPPRLLFVAHRRELLRQAADTYRRVLRTMGVRARVGWFVGEHGDLSADLVFASVAKLARRENVARLARERFDYVVIDEVHHAAADSYRRILGAVDPRFLLGLTATPDRADEADILGLFDDHVAYRADIPRGVEAGWLVPFHYFGVKDDIDYKTIPWRNRRFDPEVLAGAVQTEARMESLWRAWQEHPGQRSLVFCCSIAHADFVTRWLRARGVRVDAVYAAAGSDDRDEAIQKLAAGELDAVCSVDVFNEGIDVPLVDRVIMLRPTESRVVFLQQLGRGLRVAEGKVAVNVIDFVGNHRIFLERLRTLLSLGGSTATTSLRRLLESSAATELPAGCSVELALEAKDLLARLFKVGGADEVERVYRELRLERGARPSAGELERLGHPPGVLRARYGSWFGFVQSEGDLTGDEAGVVASAAAFLREIETTEMTRSFKMVTLQALLDAEALRTGLPLRDLAVRTHALLRRSPELFADVPEELRRPELDARLEKAWLAYWRKNPVEAWTGAKKDRRTWFRLDAAGDRFVPAFEVPAKEPGDGSGDAAERDAFARLVQELVDYRLAQYRARRRQGTTSEEGFVCRVTWNKRDPILKLPGTAATREHVPHGDRDVRVDGAIWTFRFAKEFCNVAWPAGAGRNQLPDLLRRWFGPSAGHPGTAFEVRFYASPDGLWAEPVRDNVVALGPRQGIAGYPDLRAAAGHGTDSAEHAAPEQERVMLPLPTAAANDDLFAVRISGTSMDGGRDPLRDGDWAVLRLARAASPEALRGRVVLVRAPGDGGGMHYQIKRLVGEGGRWRFASDNPAGPAFDATEETLAIARLETAFRPESLAPAEGAVLSADDAPAAFGVAELPPRSGRSGGHLFVLVDRKGMLAAPDRVREPNVTRRPGETAFVLAARPDGAWRYLGVGRWSDDDRSWRIPDVDFATWRTWGEGRAASRELPGGAAGRAQVLIDALLALPEAERWLEHPSGRRARILGPSPRGGLRIDGGEGGFEERTVSATDLAWVIVAADDVQASGGVLDEARVNRVRYLEGTPKGSTRWIDSGWALGAWKKGGGVVRAAAGGASAPRKPRDERGRDVDATFRVEPVGDGLSVVFESAGGTRGSAGARNTEYGKGLRIVLERLAASGYRIADAQVVSRDTAHVESDALRLRIEGRGYPLTIDDAEDLRRKLSRAMARVGRAPGAKGGGNGEKKIRLWLEGEPVSAEELAERIAGVAP